MYWVMAVGVLSAVACGLVGCYLVLRRMSLLGDAISHAVLPGIALAFILSGQITGWPIVLGAMALGVLTAFLTQSIHRMADVPEDASMGVVFTSLFAAGVILLTNAARGTDLDPSCVLYGLLEFAVYNTSPVFGYEVPVAAQTLLPVLLGVLAFILLLWKELKIVSFDPGLATAMGFNAALVHYLLMAVVAGVTVASFEAVGSILVIAMLIVPGATAHLLTDRLWLMMVLSGVVAALAAVSGVWLAWELENVSAAGMVAVMTGVLFALAVFFAPRHGLLRRWWRNLALAARIAGEDVLAALYRLEEARAHPEFGEAGVRERLARQTRGLRGRLRLALLRWRGLVASAADGAPVLTDAGRRRGAALVRAHRLWELYLQREFDLPLDHLHEPAEHMEHFLDEPLREELAAELAKAEVDPHGRPIPPAPGG